MIRIAHGSRHRALIIGARMTNTYRRTIPGLPLAAHAMTLLAHLLALRTVDTTRTAATPRPATVHLVATEAHVVPIATTTGMATNQRHALDQSNLMMSGMIHIGHLSHGAPAPRGMAGVMNPREVIAATAPPPTGRDATIVIAATIAEAVGTMARVAGTTTPGRMMAPGARQIVARAMVGAHAAPVCRQITMPGIPD